MPVTEKMKSVPGLLEWKHTMSKLPWTAFFMIGGAFAMAKTAKVSHSLHTGQAGLN